MEIVILNSSLVIHKLSILRDKKLNSLERLLVNYQNFFDMKH